MNYRETSRSALRRFEAVSGDLDRDIVRALEAAGVYGATCEQIEERIGRSHQSVSGNLRHLVERGIIEDSGRKGVTRSGRAAIAWRVVTDEWLQQRDAAMAGRARMEPASEPDLFGGAE